MRRPANMTRVAVAMAERTQWLLREAEGYNMTLGAFGASTGDHTNSFELETVLRALDRDELSADAVLVAKTYEESDAVEFSYNLSSGMGRKWWLPLGTL